MPTGHSFLIVLAESKLEARQRFSMRHERFDIQTMQIEWTLSDRVWLVVENCPLLFRVADNETRRGHVFSTPS